MLQVSAAIEPGDSGMGQRAAQERGVQHVRQLDVVDVVTTPGQYPPVLDPGHLRPDESHDVPLSIALIDPVSVVRRIASVTPSTID